MYYNIGETYPILSAMPVSQPIEKIDDDANWMKTNFLFDAEMLGKRVQTWR